MKKILTLTTLLFSFALLANSQTIAPLQSAEFCPGLDITFTVTIQGTNPVVSSYTNTPVLVQGAYDISSSGGNTTFKFKGKFRDVNIRQGFRVNYKNSTNQSVNFDPVFKNIKSLFYNNPVSSSCPSILPTQTTVIAPTCQVTNIPISFVNIKWSTNGENPDYCFGEITTYEYQLPAGWSLNGTTSTGANWIVGSNNVSVTSDLNTGGVIRIRPANNCGTGMANGQIPTQIVINRPSGFTVTPANPAITCGSTTAVAFTVNNVNNVPGITDHTWNLGATPNGWLLPNGNPAPQSYSTGTTNTLALTPVCGIVQSSVSASVTVSGNVCNSTVSAVTSVLPAMSINGSTSFCSGSQVYSITGLPCNASVSWVSNPQGIVNVAELNNQATLTKITNGQTNLTANITACGVQIQRNITINVGNPVAPQFIEIYGNGADDPLNLCPGAYRAEAFTTASVPEFEWMLPSGWLSSVSGGNNPFIAPGTTGFDIPITVTNLTYSPAYMRVRAKNSCGYSSAVFLEVGTNCEHLSAIAYNISPNPARDNIKIDGSKRNKAIKEIQLIDKTGNLKRTVKYSNDTKLVNFNISGLKPDIYYIKVYDGETWESKQLRIQ